MTAAMNNPCDVNEMVREAADVIRNRHRSHLRELQIKVVDGGVILYGVSVNFYGKQLALHEVIRVCQMLVLANRIEVVQRSTNN